MKATTITYNFYEERNYTPTAPCPDTDDLANASDRLMFRHARNEEPQFFVATRGILTSGWVIGIFTT